MSAETSDSLTFLFTDIEGSTKRWERKPEAMAKAVARHDEIMRAAIAMHHGHVFKTVGDAFCAVFPNAHDAIAATVTAQKAIAEEDWGEIGPIRVRMGLHTGTAEERDADYFGPTVNRVARIMSAGHGGQMLLSSATGEHAGERLPSEVRVRDLGKHRLKDLARPERLFQIIAAGLPTSFPRLKTVPSPTPGLIAAGLSVLAPLIAFRVGNRASSEDVNASLFSPLSLYTGLKGLVIELSTLNEYVLLAVGLLFLLGALGITFARWRAVRRERRLHGDVEEGRFGRWVVNQRTVAFLAALALLVLGAYAYQQYLWRVALPIPDDTLGIAMTREASAATVREQLADSLYSQGQAEQIVIRELPVVFDARDTDRAREMGKRINAKAVIIYRTDDSAADGKTRYIAYVVFTDPSIGLTIAGTPDQDARAGGPLVVKEGVPVPVLETDTLDELVNAAAGIIAYDGNRPRKAIEYLELALPSDPTAPNTGIVNFYLGNAYNLDNRPDLAAGAYEKAAAFYEQRLDSGERLGPQDQLILAKTYMERGQVDSFHDDWESSVTWYERALTFRNDLLARSDELERPTDVHASYARLYALMADAYRYLDKPEDQRSWEKRAQEEIDALVGMTDTGDAYGLVQQSTARVFIGDCAGAQKALDAALVVDPNDIDTLVNSGVIAMFQDRPDLARAYWQRISDAHPNSITGRQLIAQSYALSGLQERYYEPAYMEESEHYYLQVIQLDPTNLDAHEALVGIEMLRASGLMIDSTALVDDDDVSVSRSQYEWKLDPDRRQAVLDIYADVIDQQRLIASELEPDSAEAEVAVAETYFARQDLIYWSLVGPMFKGESVDGSDDLGKQMLADAEQVREWTSQVFDNPNATRLDTLRAWAALSHSQQEEWGWYAFVKQDEAKAAEIEAVYRQTVDDAMAFIGPDPTATTDEVGPIRMVYFQAMFITQALDENPDGATEYDQAINELTQQEQSSRKEGINHVLTSCNERREQVAGDSALAKGDIAGAKEHYQQALDANPAHVPSLQGMAAALYQDGDIDGAIEQVTAATTVAPDMPGPWIDLAVYQTVAGDTDAATTSIDRFLDLAGQRPAQERMSQIGDAIDRIETIVKDHPDATPGALDLIGRIHDFLDGMEPEPLASYQYPILYARLGEVALYADHAEAAEPLFDKAIELDPHQSVVRAQLAIALLAQGEDATDAVNAAVTEATDPYWSNVIGYEDASARITSMEQEIERYTDAYPDRRDALEPFLSSLGTGRTDADQQASGVSGNTYTSGYGYTLSWEAPWAVTASSADGGSGDDSVQLSNGTSALQLSGASGDDDPAGCLDTIITTLTGNPAFDKVTPVRNADGDAEAGTSADFAYAVFADPLEGDTSLAAVYFLGCRALPEPGTFTRVLAVVPIARYETERDGVNQVLASFSPGEAASDASSTTATMVLAGACHAGRHTSSQPCRDSAAGPCRLAGWAPHTRLPAP